MEKISLENLENEQLAAFIRAGRDLSGDATLLLMKRTEGFLVREFKKYKRFLDEEALPSITFIATRRACEIYSQERGALFITVYGWVLQSELSRALGDSINGFYVPEHTRLKLRTYDKCLKEFVQTYGREPSSSEIAAITGLSERELIELLRAESAMHPVRLDAPVKTSEGEQADVFSMGDMIADAGDLESSVLETVYQEEISDTLTEVINKYLTDEEKRAVQIRMYGATEYSGLAGLSSDQTKKYYLSGLRQLRRPICARRLRPFMENENPYVGSGINAFRRTGSGVPERIAIMHLGDVSI